jgi:hypothetical protein
MTKPKRSVAYSLRGQGSIAARRASRGCRQRARSCHCPPLDDIGYNLVGRNLLQNCAEMPVDREPVLGACMIGGEVKQAGIVAGVAENPHRAQGRTFDEFELQRGGDAKV